MSKVAVSFQASDTNNEVQVKNDQEQKKIYLERLPQF
jgi:hypothetical protein